MFDAPARPDAPAPSGGVRPQVRPTLLRLAVAALGALLAAARADAGEAPTEGLPPPPPPGRALTDAEAATARAALEDAFRSTEVPVRCAGATSAADGDHGLVAETLLRYHGREKVALVRFAIVDALGSQVRSEDKVGARLLAHVDGVVARRADQRKRGRPPVPLDANGAVPPTQEAQAALRARRDESREVALTLRALRRLGTTPKDRGASLTELLLDGDDDVAVETLGCLAAWKPTGPALHARDGVLDVLAEIYARYPTPYRWEGGAVIDLAGTNATAKAKWEARHGDPASKRARPRLVAALYAALEALTGRTFDTPAALEAWRKTQDATSGKKAGNGKQPAAR